MTDFLAALKEVATSPLALVGYIAALAAWIVAKLANARLAGILRHLDSLPESQRLAALKLEYRLYPPAGLSPAQFLRARRQTYLLIAFCVTVLVLLALAALAVYSGRQRAAARLTIEDLEISGYKYGYIWRIQVANPGVSIAALDQADLVVVGKTSHPEKNRPPELFGRVDEIKLPAISLSPTVDRVNAIRKGDYAFPSGDIQNFSFELIAHHKANDGYIYDVQLELTWHQPGEGRSRTSRGSVYRLGWPGFTFSTEPGLQPYTGFDINGFKPRSGPAVDDRFLFGEGHSCVGSAG